MTPNVGADLFLERLEKAAKAILNPPRDRFMGTLKGRFKQPVYGEWPARDAQKHMPVSPSAILALLEDRRALLEVLKRYSGQASGDQKGPTFYSPADEAIAQSEARIAKLGAGE